MEEFVWKLIEVMELLLADARQRRDYQRLEHPLFLAQIVQQARQEDPQGPRGWAAVKIVREIIEKAEEQQNEELLLILSRLFSIIMTPSPISLRWVPPRNDTTHKIPEVVGAESELDSLYSSLPRPSVIIDLRRGGLQVLKTDGENHTTSSGRNFNIPMLSLLAYMPGRDLNKQVVSEWLGSPDSNEVLAVTFGRFRKRGVPSKNELVKRTREFCTRNVRLRDRLIEHDIIRIEEKEDGTIALKDGAGLLVINSSIQHE